MFARLLKRQAILVFLIIPIFWLIVIIANQKPFSYWSEFWWMLPVAFVIALTVNTVGISGAALFVPFFILIFPLVARPLSGIQSVQIGLITESFGLSSSALAFLSFGLVDRKVAFYSIIGALPFVVGGALLASLLPETVLYLMIAILLLIAVALVRFEKEVKARREEELKRKDIDLSVETGERVVLTSKDNKNYCYCRTRSGYQKRFVGYGVGGFFQGAAGFGIGEMGIIAMNLSGIPTRIAIGTSHLVVAATAATASIIHLSLLSRASISFGLWNIPFITVPAVILGGQLAPYVAAKLPVKFLERLISLLFLLIAVALVVLAVSK
jgi:uncharacterized membrane protein YfcA